MRERTSFDAKYIKKVVLKAGVPILLALAGAYLTILSSLYFESWAVPVFASIGAALIVGGIVSLVYSYWFSQQLEVLHKELRDSQKLMEESIVNSVVALKSTSSSGVERVYENQSKLLADYASIMRQTKSRVDIFGATLIPFLWNPDFENSTINALNRGVIFRVLSLNPTSDAVKFLSRHEKRANESLNTELKWSIQRWQKLQSKALPRDAIEIRTFDDVPSSFLMITDDRLFFAPYLHSVSIVASPCFEVRAGAGLIYQTYRDYFEAIWMRASTV